MKKGDDVADDDDDDDAVRTSVSQDWVTGTSWRIVPQDSVEIAQSTYQTGKNLEGGRTVNTANLAVPAGFYTSQLVLHAINMGSPISIGFPTIILCIGMKNKVDLSISADAINFSEIIYKITL
jgi:hypothetical protein